MSEFAVTISYVLDNELQTIVLEAVNDANVNKSVIMTTHPIVSGDTVADHIIKSPKSLSLKGSFSLNGTQQVFSSGTSTLVNIQDLFERLSDEGIRCEIVKISIVNNDIRFKRRSNMVLTNISWTEKINSLDYTFNFEEALVVTVEEAEVNTDDEFLPNVTEPATLSFTDTLLDWTVIDKTLYSMLLNYDLMTEDFLNAMQSLAAGALIATGVSAAVAYIVAGFIATASIPVAGWKVALVAAAVAFTLVLAYSIYKAIDSLIKSLKYKVQQFKYYENDKKMQQEIIRFSNFVGEVHKQFEQLNESIKVYQCSSNEPQECMLTLDNNYYIFTFTKNNTNKKYNLTVTNVDNKSIAVVQDITSALTSIHECTNSNYIFRTEEVGSYVYLVRVDSTEFEETNTYDINDLTNYFIVVTTLNMSEFNNLIYDILKNALCY